MVGRILDGEGRAGVHDHGVARSDPLGAAVERDQQFTDEQEEDLLPVHGVHRGLALRGCTVPGAQFLAALQLRVGWAGDTLQ